jgi:Rod binding domain-containing protein
MAGYQISGARRQELKMQVGSIHVEGTAGQGAPSPRLARAAQEFEGQMMKELLKPMTSGDPLTGDENDSGSGSNGALSEFAAEALGQALSRSGGFGIANRIVNELSHSGPGAGSGKVTGNQHRNTVMRACQ